MRKPSQSRFKSKFKQREFFELTVAGILLISLLTNFYLFLMNFNRNRVVRVVDGDSFETNGGRRVRLLGVDAPEVDRCMGVQAKETLTLLIEGKVVKLRDQIKDNYGRELANVFVGSSFVNKEMLGRGLGRYVGNEGKRNSEMRQALTDARDRQLGIFSNLCRQVEPVTDCVIKANIRQGKKAYHLPWCKYYSQVIVDASYGDRWFCTEEEAVAAGFTKAGGCP